MAKRKRKTAVQRIWIVISIVSIAAMLVFTMLPFLSAGSPV